MSSLRNNTRILEIIMQPRWISVYTQLACQQQTCHIVPGKPSQVKALKSNHPFKSFKQVNSFKFQHYPGFNSPIVFQRIHVDTEVQMNQPSPNQDYSFGF